MNSFCLFLAMLLFLILPTGAIANLNCDNWLGRKFWEQATAKDVTRCIAAGADIEARDNESLTPLHLASRSGTLEAMQALLNAGASIEARTEGGSTPLHMAAGLDWVEGKSLPERIWVLLDAGANIEARSLGGWTPLHGAAGLSPMTTLEILQALLDAGANIEARDDDGWTPLHVAAKFGEPEYVQALLDAGANPKAQTANQERPVNLAQDNELVRNNPVFWELNKARYR